MCTHTLWNELDRGAEALRREPAVPPDAERAFPSVEGHDPAQDLEAVLAGPHHAGPEEIGRLLRLGEIHDRLVAVLLELALTERGHRPGCLGLRHTRSATPLGAIRPPHALWRRGPRSVQEPGRRQLGRDLLDGLLDVRGLARAGAHDLAAAEHEQDDLRLVDAIHEAGELLRLVLDGTEPEGDRDRVQVVPEGSRRDDVLDPELGHGDTLWAGIADTGTGGGTCTQPVPYILPSAQNQPGRPNGLCLRRPGRGIARPCRPLTSRCAPRGRSPPPTVAGAGRPGSPPRGAQSRPRRGTPSRSPSP